MFTILGEMTDAAKIIGLNPRHFGSNLADIWIRIPDHFWLKFDALAEVCAL